MGAKISSQMLSVHKLLKTGMTAYASAKKAGITQSAISKCKTCQEIIKKRKNQNAS